MKLQQDMYADHPATISTTQTGSNNSRPRLPCPKRRQKQGMSPRRNAPRDKRHGYIQCRRREGLVAIPEVEEEGEHVSDMDDQTVVQDSLSNASTLRPPGNCPVALRWESPKSTIQLEDLLFGIGSQFDDMELSPQKLSYMRTANECKRSYTRPHRAAHASVSAANTTTTRVIAKTSTTAITPPIGMANNGCYYDCERDGNYEIEQQSLLLLRKGADSPSSPLLNNGLPLAAATATKKPKPGFFYLRCLCETLTPAIRRFLAGLCGFWRWTRCGGVCMCSSRCHRQHQRRQMGEKSGDRGLIYLV